MKIDFGEFTAEEIRAARKLFRQAWAERFDPKDRHDRIALRQILLENRALVAAAIDNLIASTTTPPPPAA